jgi:hypothetical protein
VPPNLVEQSVRVGDVEGQKASEQL